MSDPRTYLAHEIKRIEGWLGKQPEKLAEHADTVARAEHDLRGLHSVMAILGDTTQLLPEHIRPADGYLGLNVGPLYIAPPKGAEVGQVRLYAASMRALYEHATHQARLAADLADTLDPEGARVRNQAVTQTQRIPSMNTIEDPPAAADPVCKHGEGEEHAWWCVPGNHAPAYPAKPAVAIPGAPEGGQQ